MPKAGEMPQQVFIIGVLVGALFLSLLRKSPFFMLENMHCQATKDWLLWKTIKHQLLNCALRNPLLAGSVRIYVFLMV